MAGGDGSQALVADVARRHDLPFVCVPAGTRSHFALDLGLDRADVAAALAAYGDVVERRIDLATIGDRVFVNNASMGYANSGQTRSTSASTARRCHRHRRCASVAARRTPGPNSTRRAGRITHPSPGRPRRTAKAASVSWAAVRDPARPTRRSGVTSSGVCGALARSWSPLQQLLAASGSVTRDGGGSPG